jgi:hypothetical protein
MAPRFHLPSPAAAHHIPRRPLANRRLHGFPLQRAIQLAAFLFVIWMGAGPAPLSAQRNESEARGIVGSLGAAVYNLAWPTAIYDGVTISQFQRVSQGFDVAIVLYGRSGINDGLLWIELVFELRNGALHDVRLGRDNHILVAPFETMRAVGRVGLAIVESVQDDQRREMLVGTWRDENSVFTYTADGWWRCDWDSGSSSAGRWTLQNGTLSWYFPDGTEIRYALVAVSTNEHRIRDVDSGTVWTARRLR